MKKLMTFFIAGAAVVGLCTAFVACNDPNDPKESEELGVDVPYSVYSSVVGVSGEETQNILINLDLWRTESITSKVVVVNSDEELEKYLWDDYTIGGQPCTLPFIDFTQKSLLLVGGTAAANVRYSAISSFQFFSSGKYIIEAELDLTTLMAWGPQWCIPVLMDKIDNNAIFEVETTDINMLR